LWRFPGLARLPVLDETRFIGRYHYVVPIGILTSDAVLNNFWTRTAFEEKLTVITCTGERCNFSMIFKAFPSPRPSYKRRQPESASELIDIYNEDGICLKELRTWQEALVLDLDGEPSNMPAV
jgi:hypothetical protein